VNNPSISLDLTKAGVSNVVVCERRNFQGTETGPIGGDTEILVCLAGLMITLTLDQLADLGQQLAEGMLALPEKRQRDHAWWERNRARKAASA